MKKFKCMNIGNCDLANTGEVFEIAEGEQEICPKCGSTMIVEAKGGFPTKLVAAIGGVAALAAVIGGIVYFSGGSETPTSVASDTDTALVVRVDSDSIKAAQMAAENQRLKDSLATIANAEKEDKDKEPSPKPPTPPKARLKNLGYAIFKGSWPSDVQGRMEFKTSHLIDSRDPKARQAEAGDYVIGEWSEGHLVQGIWYGADNQVKGSIMIGK